MAAGYSIEQRAAQMNAIIAVAGPGAKLAIFGTDRPATGGTAGGSALVTFTMGTPFAPTTATATLLPTLPADVNAAANGTAKWARLYKADGVTFVHDYGVAVSGQEVSLNTISITAGIPCSVTAFGITCGNA